MVHCGRARDGFLFHRSLITRVHISLDVDIGPIVDIGISVDIGLGKRLEILPSLVMFCRNQDDIYE